MMAPAAIAVRGDGLPPLLVLMTMWATSVKRGSPCPCSSSMAYAMLRPFHWPEGLRVRRG